MKNSIIKTVIATSLFFAPLAAFAGEDEEGRVTYRQKTEIDFEELEIEAPLQKPQSALILERKKAQFNPLIQLRTNFNPEMEQSIDEIK
jgi:hypothetical protein